MLSWYQPQAVSDKEVTGDVRLGRLHSVPSASARIPDLIICFLSVGV